MFLSTQTKHRLKSLNRYKLLMIMFILLNAALIQYFVLNSLLNLTEMIILSNHHFQLEMKWITKLWQQKI